MRKPLDLLLVIAVLAIAVLFLYTASKQVTEAAGDDETTEQVVGFTENLGYLVLGFIFLLAGSSLAIWMVITIGKK